MSASKKMILSSLNKEDVINVFKLMPVHIYWKDKDGYYLGCNQEQAKYMGFYNCDDIIGKTDYDMYSQNVADELRRNDVRIMKSGVQATIEEDGFLSTKIPLFNEKNEVVGIFGTSLVFKNYKNRIESNMKMLDKIISFIPGHVYWKDKDCILLGCNENQAIDVGLASRHEIVGKSAYDIINKKLPENIRREQAAITDKADKEIMASGIAKVFEEVVVRLDGTETVYLSQKTPLYDDENNIIGLLGISIDITDRKKLEAQLLNATFLAEAANLLKTEFIQNMQHDIRTPISGIFSLLDATNQSGNFDDFKKALPYAVKASKELLDFCNEVIDFENIEYGTKPLYIRKFSLLELLHGAINLNSAAVLVHKSTLELNVSDNVPDVIKGDDYRLKKILINLIGNAVKFTENGKINLCVKVINQQEKQTTIRFKVSDTGIGISDDKIHTIFEKFTRLNPSNTGKFKGSGLGLHIVKKFVEEIDAELDVKSTIGKGTVFTVDVTFDLPKVSQLADEEVHHELGRHLLVDIDIEESPKIPVAAPSHKISASAVPANLAGENVIRVCLIEDDMLAMMAAENILSGMPRPCQIAKAVNVAEALMLLNQQPFDVVISDLGLPDGSGFDIAAAIMQDTKHINHKTPFVALTAHSDDAKRERAKAAGFLSVYNKPLSKINADKILTDYVPDKRAVPQHKIVDFEMSVESYSGNEETVIRMLTVLVSSFAKERVFFEDAFNTNNFTRARELFHKFRGGLSYIRVPEVEKLAMMLHEDVKAFEVSNTPLETLNNKLHAMFKAVDEVEAWLANHQKKKL